MKNLSLIKSIFVTNMLFIFLIKPSQGQQFNLNRTHPISLNKKVHQLPPAVGTLNLVAVMVEFQADTNRLTSGTGIFGLNGFDGLPYLSREEQTFIDPLPHNRDYFETHLEFAKNYFLKSSDNQLTINYQVLPQVYKLDKPMEEYSPIGERFTLEKIANLMQDVWSKVDSEGGFDATGLDPQSTAFIIFHAGIGRDIELTGTSLEITPFDLPSITLDQENLAQLLNDPSFDGFSINNDTFRVTNSMLIPRTQSRKGTDISDNEIVFPLSINGLLCASIGSYLGLPDLFNTENGQPAIGRFGLMDGAGFFAYNGLLPPEPSAWEKVFLGWIDPISIPYNAKNPIELAAGSLDEPNSIAKIELSSSEYFLVENRHRDPNLLSETEASVTITTRTLDENLVDKIFTNLDEDFILQAAGFDTMLTPGTIVDVSNFDWSLPGGIDAGEDEKMDTEDDRHLNGGILIWHIDERVLAQELDTDRVNANENRRGVDLEEGDGAQDIGKSAGLLDNSPIFGYAYDFWWAGNDYRVITQTTEIDLNPNNEFGASTYPNNHSNSGARSGFELYDFSDNLPVASFRIREASNTNIKTLISESIPFINELGANYILTQNVTNFPLSLALYKEMDNDFVIIPGRSDVLAYKMGAHTGDRFLPLHSFGNQLQPLITYGVILNTKPDIPSKKSKLTSYIWNDATSKFEIQWRDSVIFNNEKLYAFYSSQNGSIVDIDFTEFSFSNADGSSQPNTSGYEFRSEIINDKFVAINGNKVEFIGENIPDYLANYDHRLFAGTIQTNTGNHYYIFEDGRFLLVKPTKDEPIKIIFEEENAEWPAIVDEGLIYRINRTQNTIEGYNFNGARLANTPILAPDSIQFIGTPIISDITGDNRQDILVIGQDKYSMNIFAYEIDGNLIEEFPLYVGGAIGKNIQPIHPVMYEDALYAVSHTGDLRAWKFLNHTTTQWSGRYGENPYNKVSAYITLSNKSEQSFSVLNKSETYNWPNPAREETNIRYQLESAGMVDITIIDLTGRIIYENKVQSIGGSPEEITVNTSEWGSGAYFARVEAEINGRKSSKMIKIAVAH
jgi:M6 family metalloprotease-like protein